MSIEKRLLLAISLIFVAAFGIDVTLSYQEGKKDAITSLRDQAERVRAIMMATQRVYQKQFLASGIPLTDKTVGFLPGHSFSLISKDFENWDETGMSFNNVSDRPRNPNNAADPLELEVMDHFRANPQDKAVFRPFTSPEGEDFYLSAWPIWTEDYCLKCHGKRSETPPTIRDLYTTAFDYKVGDLRGLISIKLPVSHIQDAVARSIRKEIILHLLPFIAVFLIIVLLIRRYVRYPLEHLATGMDEIATGRYDRRIEGLKGELAGIGNSFNVMAAEIPRDQESLRKLSQAVEQSPAAVMITDPNAIIEYVNPKFENFTGYARDEAVGQHSRILGSGETPTETYNEMWSAITSGQEWRGEFLNRHKNGTHYWESALIAPIKDNASTITHFLAVKEDITEQKAITRQMEHKAREEEALGQLLRLSLEPAPEEHYLQAFLNIMFDSVPFLDQLPKGAIFLAEQKDGKDILRLTATYRLDPELFEICAEIPFGKCLCGQAAETRDLIMELHNDKAHETPFEGMKGHTHYNIPVLSGDDVLGVINLYLPGAHRRDEREISFLWRIAEVLSIGLSRLRAEMTVKSTIQELARSNAELERFAYIASHDLQEPVRTLVSYSQLLEKRYEGDLDADARDYIEFIVGGAKRLRTLVQDLLVYSQANSKSAMFQQVDLTVVLEAAMENLATSISESGAKITHGPLPKVVGDDIQLIQLLQNLIHNAIKFRRPDSPLEIRVESVRQDSEWIISVADKGIGIEEQYMDQIFVIFKRLHTIDTYPGTGIGLAICKRIIEHHNGRIWLESEPGVGTTFHFSLPADVPEEEANADT